LGSPKMPVHWTNAKKLKLKGLTVFSGPGKKEKRRKIYEQS
jgi:hypothetical protein